MQRESYIEKTIAYVKRELAQAEKGHDWWHIQRVLKNARYIQRIEGGDLKTIELGALLHDIADAKFHDGNEELGPQKAEAWMQSIGIDAPTTESVVQIIKNLSFKGGNFERTYSSPELSVVQDADRLDALGAIGIARAFHFGGFKNRTMFDPEIAPVMHMDKETYKKSDAPTLNHFYEKLFRLKELMLTPTGKEMAQKRHDFMREFVETFYEEWGQTPAWHPLSESGNLNS